MLSEQMMALGKTRSVIREIFEYGNKRKQEIGADKVFDFSFGNPSVPAPESVNQAIRDILDEMDSTAIHGYTSAPYPQSAFLVFPLYISSASKTFLDYSLIRDNRSFL